MLLGLGTCVGGSLYLRRKIRQDPKGFERQVKGMARGMVEKLIKDDWAFLRISIDQLHTDEGAKAFYAANPKLKGQYPSEGEFLAASKGWKARLEPIPEAIPDLDSHDLDYQKQFGGEVVLGYRCTNGTRIRMVWDSPKIAGSASSHQLTEFTVR